MKVLAFVLFIVVAVAAPPPSTQNFAGIITDDMCGQADHSQMKMGPTDAECTKACVSIHGASYVLYDGKDVYTLSDQRTPEKFAGQRVTVTGTLDVKTKTIRVNTITARN